MQKMRAREKAFIAADIWPTNVMSNHDLPRAASRYTRGENDAQARIAMALLLTLRGTAFMYYGEEIGMRDIRLPHRKILDPAGKKYWPIYKGRDGCRSPMQWNERQFAGFSSIKPWLPVNPDHIQRNVAAQEADPHSLLNFTKKLLSLRRNHSALHRGDFIPLDARQGVLAYLRTKEQQTVLVALNFQGRNANYLFPPGNWRILLANNSDPAEATSPLDPYEVRMLIK
jgi:alpha-glucosidase